MKVTIIGTSNAWGPNEFLMPGPPWPMTGELANGAQVVIRKYRTSLLVESADGKKILVDCGPDFSHQLREFGFGVVDAILLTHPHLDHIGGLDDINLYRPTARLPIPAFASEACWNCIRNNRGLGYVINPLGLVAENHLTFDPNHRAFVVGSVRVTPFQVEHNSIAPGAVGFIFEETMPGQIRRVLYTGDLWAFSDPTDPLFRQQFDAAIVECDRWDGWSGPLVGGGHMSFLEAVRMLSNGALSAPRPKQVIFVHFGDNGPNGTASTYQNWRDSIINHLQADGLAGVIPNHDAVIGYEGLVI